MHNSYEYLRVLQSNANGLENNHINETCMT